MPDQLRVCYLRSRHELHSAFQKLAEAVNADVIRTPHVFSHPDLGRFAKLKTLINELWAGFWITRFRRYDVIILNGFTYKPYFWNLFRRKPKHPVTVMLHIGEQLYLLDTHQYGARNERIMRKAIAACDAQLAVGRVQTELAHLADAAHRTVVVRADATAVNEDRYQQLAALQPNLHNPEVLFIGDVYAPWRIQYKGLDHLLQALPAVLSTLPHLQLRLVGILYPAQVEPYLQPLPPAVRERVRMESTVREIQAMYADHALLVLAGRGDAFPVTVLEAMSAGIVPIVCEETGNCDVVRAIAPQLVCQPTVESLAESISWYWQQPLEVRQELSARARAEVQHYRAAEGCRRFVEGITEAHTRVWAQRQQKRAAL